MTENKQPVDKDDENTEPNQQQPDAQSGGLRPGAQLEQQLRCTSVMRWRNLGAVAVQQLAL